MLTRVVSSRGVLRVALGRLVCWGALGVAGGAATACSDFSTPDCSESHTCAPTHPDAASGAPDAGVMNGGSGGSPGSGGTPVNGGAAGLVAGGGGSAGMHPLASPDGGDADGASDAGHAEGDAGEGGLECPAGLGDCNRDPTDGCEVDFSKDPDHCGDCGTECADTGAKTRVCQQSVCKPICDATHADCNRDGNDGCEADLTGDAANCNACGHACPTDGSTATACQDRACKPTCDATHADCNHDGNDGCEVDLATDTDNCGACKRACSTDHTTAVACVDSVCKPTCAVNYADCTTASPPPLNDDGCEANFLTGQNCGACGHDCLGGSCSVGQCQPVPLARGLKSPTALVVDDTYIHWIDTGTTQNQVRRITLAGAGPTAVTDGVAISSIASDGGHVYWAVRDSGGSGASDGSIVRIDTGKTVTTTIQNGIDPLELAADSSHVFWRSDKDSAVYVAGHDPGDKATQLIQGINGVKQIVSDGSTVFVSTGGLLYLVSIAQGTQATQGSIASMSLDPFALSIAANTNYVYAWFLDGTSPYQLLSFTKPAFGSLTSLAKSASGGFLPLAADDDYAYFAQQDGVYRVSAKTKGATPEHLAATGGLATLTVSRKVLYWIEINSSGIGNAIQKLVTF